MLHSWVERQPAWLRFLVVNGSTALFATVLLIGWDMLSEGESFGKALRDDALFAPLLLVSMYVWSLIEERRKRRDGSHESTDP